MMEALSPSVNFTSPESRRPYKMKTSTTDLSLRVQDNNSHHEIVLHEIENKIEGAFVFPEMARSDRMVNLGEETTVCCATQ